jgi:hypothetical protein
MNRWIVVSIFAAGAFVGAVLQTVVILSGGC